MSREPDERVSPPDRDGGGHHVGDAVARLRLTVLLERYPRPAVMGVFAFLNGVLTIGILATLAMVTDTPTLFPSLGPTAFLLFSTPMLASASPRNSIEGHLVGVLAGYLSLVVFGARVLAAALSLGLTSGVMVVANRPHPPAGATTLIVSLGILDEPWELVVLMLAVVLMVIQGYVINRLAGLPYPRWAPVPSPPSAGSRAG